MGANFSTIQFKEKDESKLRKRFSEYQNELEHEYGHNAYNGTLATCNGLSITSKLFATKKEAENYIMDNTNKWDSALAVRVFVPSKDFSDTKVGATIKKELDTLNKELDDLINKYSTFKEKEEFFSKRKEVESKISELYKVFHTKENNYKARQFTKPSKRPKKFYYLIGGWCAE